MVKGCNYYWGFLYEIDESFFGRFFRGKKFLICFGIFINSIELIYLLICDFDVEFIDFIFFEWLVCYLNDDFDYFGVYSLSDVWFKCNL